MKLLAWRIVRGEVPHQGCQLGDFKDVQKVLEAFKVLLDLHAQASDHERSGEEVMVTGSPDAHGACAAASMGLRLAAASGRPHSRYDAVARW